jgi:putative ABC transport system permease protein
MNSLLEALRIAARGLTVNKVRSSLTMLGIIIGVTAVIALVSVGQGFSSYVTTQFASLGTNVLNIGRNRGVDNPQPLTTADAAALADPVAVHNVTAVAPTYQGDVNVSYNQVYATTTSVGVTPEYQLARSYTMASGRFITKEDSDTRARVVVLGDTVAQTLFPNDPYPIGQTIRVQNIAFDVVGVLAPKGGSGFNNGDDVALVPLTTAQTRLFSVATVRGDYVVSQIQVVTTSKDVMDAVTTEVTAVLRQRHRIADGDESDFNIFNPADVLSTMTNITGTLTLFLGAIAAISLLVGGIGIMNIMLVSVTERTREIGLRKAIGAGRSDILLQFLIEAMALSLIGGLIGVGAGMGASRLIGPALNVQTVVTPTSIILAVGFSATIGIVFGIYPAMRAARLQPVVALRFE